MGHPALSEQFVLAKCDYFVDVHLWPLTAELDPRPWLSNFDEAETGVALRLLDMFQYFSQPLVDQLFVSAFQQLSTTVAVPGSMPLAVQSAWLQFCRDAIVTHVEGESPNPTDSGYLFARRARQLLGIGEEQIMQPDDALDAWRRAPSRPIVFVDDFVGSGQQFEVTWYRPRPRTGDLSFHDLAAGSSRAFYCPLVGTRKGTKYITDYCPHVEVRPVHVVDAKHDGVLADDSVAWSDDERDQARSIIHDASMRAGIPEAGHSRWDGFEGLGLALAFSHSVPDATLPIFYWDNGGWRPLLRRR